MYNGLRGFQCKRLLPKSSKKKNKLTKKSKHAHPDTTCLFVFSFMFRGIPGIQIPGLSTSCTVESKHHYFWAPLFMSLCRRLLESWTLVRLCSGSQGYRCHRFRCSIPQSQLQSPPPRTRRRGWCRPRTARPPRFPDRPVSARQSGRKRKRVITQCGQSPRCMGGEVSPVITRGWLRIWLAVRYYTADKQVQQVREIIFLTKKLRNIKVYGG